jgi:hypothetical protein
LLRRYAKTGTAVDNRYSDNRRTDGEGFSPLEPLAYWEDIHRSGATSNSIKLIAIGGGAISKAECCMAAALGVPVAIAGNGGEPAELLDDPVLSSIEHIRGILIDEHALKQFIMS